MMRWLTIASVLAVAGAAQAGDSGDADCSNAMTQNDMNICADKEYQAADHRLNDVYRKVSALQKDKASKDSLVAAERAWLGYRDAECTFETAADLGGSIYPMEYAMCLAKLTKARTQELDDYLTCEADATKCN